MTFKPNIFGLNIICKDDWDAVLFKLRYLNNCKFIPDEDERIPALVTEKLQLL